MRRTGRKEIDRAATEVVAEEFLHARADRVHGGESGVLLISDRCDAAITRLDTC
jgi:hypothetical protein